MGDLEAIRTALEHAALPKHVVRTVVELGLDATDDPAVWIWVVLEDAAPAEAWSWPQIEALSESVRGAVSSTGTERWPYVMFRSHSEQREIEAGHVAA